MARSADSVRRRLWQQRLQRFERGRLSVAAFCQAEGVSSASFYQWQRVLGRGTAHRVVHPPATLAPTAPSASHRQAFVPIAVVAAATIEIHLTNGVRLAVPAGDRAALE